MLAAYAEGKVSGTERDAIRKYLADNPSELHTVAMMMDEDYDMDVEDNNVGAKISKLPSVSNLCCSAVAFAPIQMVNIKKLLNDNRQPKGSFDKKLNDLMDDLDSITD